MVFIRAQNAAWVNCDEDCLLDLSNFLEYISSTVRCVTTVELTVSLVLREDNFDMYTMCTQGFYCNYSMVSFVEGTLFTCQLCHLIFLLYPALIFITTSRRTLVETVVSLEC